MRCSRRLSLQLCRAPFALKTHALAHHHLCQPFTGGSSRDRVAHHPAPAQHRHPVGDTQHFLQLVRDKDQRLAVGPQLAHHPEQALDLLRSEHAGRLVENQHRDAAQQRAQNLDALFFAGREIGHAGVGIDRQAVAAAQLSNLATHAACRKERRPGSQRQILGHRMPQNQHWMLRHQPDAQPQGVGGRGHPHLLTRQQHLALVRTVQTIQDGNKCRFARAVLAQQRQHLAPLQAERHVVVGDYAGKALGDVLKLQHRKAGKIGHAPPGGEKSNRNRLNRTG